MARLAFVMAVALGAPTVAAPVHAQLDAEREQSPGAEPPARPATPPPEELYVEPQPSADAPEAEPARPRPQPRPRPRPGAETGIYEPAPPGPPLAQYVYEPPPPPEPHHVAPRRSLWLGGRVGYFLPFGNAWARGVPRDRYIELRGVPFRDYAGPGPMFEVDVGLRLGRTYNVFALWERAELGAGNAESNLYGGQVGGDTDFWGVGLRASSDANEIGFLTEIALGYRRARAVWDDGTELQLTDAPFEARLGFGADIRFGKAFSLSPMLTLGVGSFGKVERVSADGIRQSEATYWDQAASHGWVTFQLGGHFDLIRSRD